MTTDEMEAAEAFHSFVEDFRQNVDDLAEEIVTDLRDDPRGFDVDDPAELWDIDFALWIPVTYRGTEYTAELSIANSLEHAGEQYGCNFELMVVEFGGRIIGQWCPYNYTDRCWIDFRDDVELEDRWTTFTRPDLAGEISDIILSDHQRREGS